MPTRDCSPMYVNNFPAGECLQSGCSWIYFFDAVELGTIERSPPLPASTPASEPRPPPPTRNPSQLVFVKLN